ncbi:MAG: RNA polymerase sigma factor [Lachnospiraceae bacterium]|nr:RNA polymerase sigma factor [Lachnospiraceae bacterium]
MEIEVIYRKYFHEVFLYIRTLSGNESIAEEIAQETFVRALRNIEKFDGREDIRAWLFTVARNAYFRYCRRNRIYMDGELLHSVPDPSPPVLERLMEEETVQCIEESVELLPRLYKEVFRLRIYGGLPFEKIGDAYGKSAGWARVTYHRAKQMIQKKMRREARESGEGEL